jgi:hypothetical protein
MRNKSVIRYPSSQETRALAQFRCVSGVYVCDGESAGHLVNGAATRLLGAAEGGLTHTPRRCAALRYPSAVGLLQARRGCRRWVSAQGRWECGGEGSAVRSSLAHAMDRKSSVVQT